MESKNKLCARKATWLAFGLIALAASISSAQDTAQPNSILEAIHTVQDITTTAEQSTPSEAARAYKQALSTLTSLKAHPSQHTFDPALASGNGNSKSIFSSFLPNLQGQGPIGSLVRILMKLHNSVNRVTNVLSPEGLGLGSKKKDEERRRKAIKVIDLLELSAELGNTDALFTLGQVSLFPPTQHFIMNPQLAYRAFSSHAAQTGNATSQSYISFFHATGFKDVVPVDQGKAQLYTTFAANGGDKGAQMTLGYRYWSGIGTSESCDSALSWYGSAAEQAMAKFMSGPPGGRTLPQTATRLSDLNGGIFGPGASVASTGINAQRPAVKAGVARASGETWEDVLEYYLFNAERGEIDFAYRLGKIFYQGSIYATPGGIASGSEGVGAIPRNYRLARRYFLLIARQLWPHDPPSTTQIKDDKRPVNHATLAAGYLGRMYLRGEGVAVDYSMAKAWFERGAEHGDRECHNGLGIIYRDGLGVKPDTKKSVAHFNIAAGQELAEAQVNIGKYHYNRGELTLATTYFETAIRYGSPFEAYYYLGEIHSAQASNTALPSHLSSSSCAMAVSFYKLVAERGVWEDDLLRDAEIAWMSGTDQGKELAMLKWQIAAERGYEIAQNNLAYVLDQDKSILRMTRFAPTTFSKDAARLALTNWIRAAGQRNIDALVKVADYYYHGLGVPEDESDQSRLEKAAKYYQSASDTQLSALAMWNLGWMYENGVGVPQDFHLAKRHYDLALETNSEAYLPVILSLGKLYVRSIWHTLMGGQGGLSLWGSDEEITKPAQGKQIEDGTLAPGGEEAVDDEYQEEEDGPWYFGKAKEEFQRRSGQITDSRRPRREEEDPIQWARERRDADRERDSELGPEDYFDGMRAGNRDDAELDEFGETMVLVILCLVISILLYIRTRIVERMRRDQREQQAGDQQGPANGPDGGLFPPPGDPARNDWAILR
ncbi:putative Sel1-like repeat-containing protein C1B3.10c [Psilocybe cubensis]|uniref:Sel1-like repeat-containing protein C1B3.10c n=2 Tax=Psilocybe cubensis TaxID=181762 RepID=A0ACB8HEB0_PSICU|nr:putative Sel1-like repeat-containing protein C1B3.10c [Psilocybe cubensis]KAH9485480.1 putative Sel1-like repeat-containing protein C1B3.10c [Psilocybe cubensis]